MIEALVQVDSLAVARHALEAVGEDYEYIVLLQPTSPLRTSEDIEACIDLCRERGASTCVSVVEADKTPYWMFRRDGEQRLVPLFPSNVRPARRQDAQPVYMLNGAVYVARVRHLREGGTFIATDTLSYVMERSRSVDIDTEDDLASVQRLFDRG